MIYFKNNLSDYIPLTTDMILPLSEIKYEGQIFKAPHDSKKYLETHYGYLGTGAVYNP